MEKRRSGKYIILLIACLVLVVAAIAIFGDFKTENEPAKIPDSTAQASVSPSAVLDTPSAAPTTAPPADPTTAASTPTPAAPAPTPASSDGAPDVPAQAAADDEYFSDACFVGNSLVDGLYLYGGVTNCDWLCATGVSIYNIRTQAISDKKGGQCTVMDGLAKKQYGKVYILLGINEIGAPAKDFAASYSTLLDDIRALQPSAKIYVMSLTPVSAAKSSASTYFTKDNVLAYNSALHQLCAEKGLWYVDNYTPFADADGFLPADDTPDGVHFSVNCYQAWMSNVIRTHYV